MGSVQNESIRDNIIPKEGQMVMWVLDDIEVGVRYV